MGGGVSILAYSNVFIARVRARTHTGILVFLLSQVSRVTLVTAFIFLNFSV